MDRYRIFEALTVSRPVLVDGNETFEDVTVPGAVVTVGGQKVTADPTVERRQVFAETDINGLMIDSGKMPADRRVSYAGKAKVHSIVAYSGKDDAETVTGSMRVNRSGPFEVEFVPDR